MTQQALLVMDVQVGIVSRYSESAPDYLPRLRTALDHAHRAAVPVIYVVIGFRDGHPEVSAANKTFSTLATGNRFTAADPNAAIHPDVAPADGDPEVHRVLTEKVFPRQAEVSTVAGWVGQQIA
jgi:nicotinamidase-related amidase